MFRQAEIVLNASENEESHSKGFDKPIEASCPDKFVGPTTFDSSFKNLVFAELERGKESQKAPLNNIMSGYEFSTGNSAARSSQSLQKSNGLPLKGSLSVSVPNSSPEVASLNKFSHSEGKKKVVPQSSS